ncbi:unnamed protein product [Oncorhynchus mykiss]|uniref:Uncharacterized protein n=1 Tax=Oncorhynchus mykiss TaxID=8022 RepID=A0A060Y7S2_ONCMY|nr:unnamed protein product [Oncorhynchus mykiss]
MLCRLSGGATGVQRYKSNPAWSAKCMLTSPSSRYELRMNVNQQTPMASPYGPPQPGYGQPSYAPLGGGYPGPYGPYNGPAAAYQPGAPPQGYSPYASFPSKAVAANPVSDLSSPLDLGPARGPLTSAPRPVSTPQAYSQYPQGDSQNGPPPMDHSMAQPAHRSDHTHTHTHTHSIYNRQRCMCV